MVIISGYCLYAIVLPVGPGVPLIPGGPLLPCEPRSPRDPGWPLSPLPAVTISQ